MPPPISKPALRNIAVHFSLSVKAQSRGEASAKSGQVELSPSALDILSLISGIPVATP